MKKCTECVLHENCYIAGMFDNAENCKDFIDITTTSDLQVIRVRDYSRQIVEVFEEILDRYDMQIPDDFRTGDESESPLFGAEWYEAMYQVTDILEDLLEEREKKPDAILNYEEY